MMEPLVFFRCHSSNSSGGGIAKSVVVREFFGFLTIPPVSVVPFDLGCDANKGDEIVLGVVHFRIHRQSWNTHIEEDFPPGQMKVTSSSLNSSRWGIPISIEAGLT